MEISLGQSATVVRHVTHTDTAQAVGSGDLAVLGTPILLAWAYVESGQLEKAKPLLAFWPIPRAGGDPFLESLAWPRLLELRKRAGL